MKRLPKATHWAWDIETAIDGKIVDYPTMLSCASDDAAFVAVGEDNIRSLAFSLRNSGAELVTWNGWAFDEPTMKRWGIEMPMSHDGMVMAYFDDETQALGLEACAVKYLGVKGWKHGAWKTFDPNSYEAAQYAARDARYTLELYRRLDVLLGARVQTIRKIIQPARIALDRETERGIWIDPVAVERERIAAEEQRDKSLAKIRELAGPDINPNSSSQIGAYLTANGVELPLTDTGKPCTNIEVLNGISSDFARSLVEYRGATKTLSTYVRRYEDITWTGDGRVHPEYTLIRTLTGRSSARNLNVQNLNRSFKDFFAAPPGRAFVEVDFSAIEFRIAAWLAREETILESYADNPDWDPHRFVASLFYSKPGELVTKAERQIAKSANFGLLYLGNGVTLYDYAKKMGVEITISEAEQLYRFFHETFPGFKRFYADVKREIITTGQAACPTGHIRHFGDFSALLPMMRLEALRQAVNVKVQNTAAHLAYIALAELDRRGLPHIGFVHDAFFFEFENEEKARDSLPEIEYCMTEYPVTFLAENFSVNLDIPLRVESKVRVNEQTV